MTLISKNQRWHDAYCFLAFSLTNQRVQSILQSVDSASPWTSFGSRITSSGNEEKSEKRGKKKKKSNFASRPSDYARSDSEFPPLNEETFKMKDQTSYWNVMIKWCGSFKWCRKRQSRFWSSSIPRLCAVLPSKSVWVDAFFLLGGAADSDIAKNFSLERNLASRQA